jgi:hypothetical protein
MPDTFVRLARESRALTAALWARRAVMGLLALVALLALLNRFGQQPAQSTAQTPAATMTLSSPSTVRGGLFFQSRLEIRAARAIEHPRLVLDSGWVEGMQVNSITPEPVGETSRDGRPVLSYDALEPGELLRILFQFEVNPTNVGRRSYGIELDDAERPLARLSPDITVLP